MIYHIYIYANHPLNHSVSHGHSRFKAQNRMWSWPHALEFTRELRFFLGGFGGSTDCNCSLPILICTAIICLTAGFWFGCAISACVLSPKCRRFSAELAQLGLQVFFGHHRPAPPSPQPAQEASLRRRLQQYRA